MEESQARDNDIVAGVTEHTTSAIGRSEMNHCETRKSLWSSPGSKSKEKFILRWYVAHTCNDDTTRGTIKNLVQEAENRRQTTTTLSQTLCGWSVVVA